MAEEVFQRFADEYGPEKIVYIYEPRNGLHAIVVIDNIAAGPAIGGIRMAPDVTTEEVFRLAHISFAVLVIGTFVVAPPKWRLKK